jgi:hypothetical protein
MIYDRNIHQEANIDPAKIRGGLGSVLRHDSNQYFVDGRYGNDNNSGRSVGQPFVTIAKAITVVNARIGWSNSPWANGDKITIFPGAYAEALTSMPYGCEIHGEGDAFDLNGERGVTIKPASGSPVDATSVINSKIDNICFAAPTDAGTEALFQADNFNRNIMTRCLFAGVAGASPTTTRGFEVVKDMTGNRLIGCQWLVCRNGIYINTDNANSKQASGNIIEDFVITGGDQTGIYFDVNSVPSYTQVNHGVINGGGTTLALGIDDDTDLIHCNDVMIEATNNDPISTAGRYNKCYLNGALIT